MRWRLKLRLDALALLLLALGALALAYQASQAYSLDTRGVALGGFHASEGSGNRRFRWTDGHADAHFDGIGSRAYRLTLNLSGPRPAGLPPPTVHIAANGVPLAEFPMTSASRQYSLTVPAEIVSSGGSLDVAIDSDSFVPPNDLRTLGVAVADVRVEPLDGGGFTWPAPLTLLWGAVAVVGCFLAASRRPIKVSEAESPGQPVGAGRGGSTPGNAPGHVARDLRSLAGWPGGLCPGHRRAREWGSLAGWPGGLCPGHRRAREWGSLAGWLAALAVLGTLGAALASERVLSASVMPWAALAGASAYAGARIRQRAGWAETAAALAVLLSLLHFVLSFLNLFAVSRFTDVTTMFEAAQKLAQGLDPYDYGVIRDNPLYAHSYVYPPAFAQLLGLLLPLGMQGAIVCWVALNFVLYFVALAGLLRLFQLRPRSAGMYALLLVAFNYQPVIDTLFGGQLDVLILTLLVLSLALALRGRLASSGVALAFAAITKLHPLLVLPFFLARSRWRGLAGFALAFALIVGVSVVLSPPELYARYATIVLPGRGGGGTGNAENQSLAGFFYRASAFLWNDAPAADQERVLRTWTYGAGALLGAVTLGVMLYTLRGDDHGGKPLLANLHFSSFIALMLLILPTSWMHYETQLLLPLAALLAYALANRSRTLIALWAAASGLTAFGNWELFSSGAFDAWPLSLLQSYKLCGVLLVWGALLWAMLKESKTGNVVRDPAR